MTISELHSIFLNTSGISTDTRSIKKNSIFFALKGANFNGNKFAKKALQLGASYAVVDEQDFAENNSKIILFDNALSCLQKLASFHRDYLNIPIIALTGSNGKTTTKELIREVLSKKYNVGATIGNLNNHIGVPLTLLSFDKTIEIGIVEMGANHQKEIDFLCKIAKPDYGYITNFGFAHLEGFGGFEGVVKGKTELYKFLIGANKRIFVNGEDSLQIEHSKRAEVIVFNHLESTYKIDLVGVNPMVIVDVDGLRINSNLIGKYNFSNISASICIGLHFNIEIKRIKEALEDYTPRNNRSQIIEKDGLKIILDAYNANPSSMKAALDNLNQMNIFPKYVVLGDMFELGEESKEQHRNIATIVRESNFNRAFLVGEYFTSIDMFSDKIFSFLSKQSLIESDSFKGIDNGVILIKGSRGMALEYILDNLPN